VTDNDQLPGLTSPKKAFSRRRDDYSVMFTTVRQGSYVSDANTAVFGDLAAFFSG
jgi:hypothetical protein